MKAFVFAAALLMQQPPLPLPLELNVSQIATQAGTAVATPATAQAAPGAGQLPATQLDVDPQAPNEPIEVEVNNGDLRPLLTLLAQYHGFNLMMAPEISATVTINLEGVSLEDALQVILTPLDLQYEIEGDLLHVRAPQVVRRTFEFDYITTSRSLSRSLSASASAGGGGSGGSSGGGGGGSSTSVSGSEATDLLSDVETGLAQLLSGEGSFVFNRMASLIFVSDFERNLDAVSTYLELIQNAVNRQVVIEARILEVKLNDNHQTGVDWSAILGTTGNIIQSFGTGQGGFNLGVSSDSFTGLVQILSQHGTVNILSSPSVSTLNNQPAVMRVGTQDVFFTTTNQVDPTTGAITSSTTTPSTINEGIVLDVTPQIGSNGIITMNIHPTITERTGQATSPDGISVPIVDVRETDTVIRVADGETAVIAGLMSDRTLQETNKVPVLGDIPLIGRIFRRTEMETRKTDMVILLSPRILTIRTAADYARERMEQQEALKGGGTQNQ